MEIKKEESESKGRLIAIEAEQELGEMTYSVASDELIIVDHTGVNDGHNGKGVGKKLFEALVKQSRTDGRKVMPLCPFARAMFERHPDTHDVLRHGSL